MNAICKTRSGRGATLTHVAEPRLQSGHVLVRVERTSLCGTDLHIWNWDSWAADRVRPPLVLGHEFYGVVEATGDGVADLVPGDFVAGESHIVCGTCRQCQSGQGHVCKNTQILGIDTEGCWSTYVQVPAANARKTAVGIPPEVATIQDPLGNAVHATCAWPIEGQHVLITGVGPIGLMSIGVARACGAAQVIVSEISPYRRQLAEAMGADLILDPERDDMVRAIHRATHGHGVDVALEMSGNGAALHLLLETVRYGGCVSLLGIFAEPVTVSISALIFRGLAVYGVVGRRLYDTWEIMQRLLASGKLDIRPIITHTLPYTEWEHAFQLMQAGQCGKVILCWAGDS